MRLTDAQRATLRAFEAKFPIPRTDERRREWTHQLAEQFRFTYGPAWGHKSAGAGRPHSADVLAYQDGATFIGFDTQNGTVDPPTLVDDPDPIDLTGQVFEPVEPVDYLAAGGPEPDPDEGPIRLEVDFPIEPFLERLDAVAVLLRSIEAELKQGIRLRFR